MGFLLRIWRSFKRFLSVKPRPNYIDGVCIDGNILVNGCAPNVLPFTLTMTNDTPKKKGRHTKRDPKTGRFTK